MNFLKNKIKESYGKKEKKKKRKRKRKHTHNLLKIVQVSIS
jgi:hypothetical protein